MAIFNLFRTYAVECSKSCSSAIYRRRTQFPTPDESGNYSKDSIKALVGNNDPPFRESQSCSLLKCVTPIGKVIFFRKNAFWTSEICSFELKAEIVDFRLSYAAFNALAAWNPSCRWCFSSAHRSLASVSLELLSPLYRVVAFWVGLWQP